MATRAAATTKEYLKNIPLPVFAKSYTVISHGDVIDTALDLLEKQGLVVEQELYKCNADGEVAQGVYKIKDEQDPEMSMMFAWSNSYDKSMRFKAAIGAKVNVSGNSIIAGDHSNWGRKHTGTALQEAIDTIKHQIVNGATYYSQLLEDKRRMANIITPIRYQAELLGRILFEDKILSLEQMSIVKTEMKKPSFDYGENYDKDSLWIFYNNIICALKKAHPRHWMDQQRQVHHFLCQEFNMGNHQTIPLIETPVEVVIQKEGMLSLDTPVDPRQINLLDMISDVEKEEVGKVFADQADNLIEIEGIPAAPETQAMIKEVTESLSEEITEILDEDRLNNAVADTVLEDQLGEKPFPLNLDDITPEPIIADNTFSLDGEVQLSPEQLAIIEQNMKMVQEEIKAETPVDPDAGVDFNL
jgi:hypothetical protein